MIAFVLAAAAVWAAAVEDPVLKPGDLAPDFALQGSDGRVHRLSDHRGVRPVVLAWFPKSYATL
jgi:peroxiredoxin Q/BCP